jgi:hypothetical protein
MPAQNIPTAKAFQEAFIASYYKARACFTEAERWDDFSWGPYASANFTSLMLRTSRLPSEISAPVLAEVAAGLGLCYPNCHPMTIDAVFADHSAQRDWFPISVAIEHENVRTNFWSEVCKLFSVRCPLKVGITYITSSDPRNGLGQITENVRSNFALISQMAGEDPGTEYLFLVGVERRVSLWYALDFRGSDGPESKTFQPAEIPSPVMKGVA